MIRKIRSFSLVIPISALLLSACATAFGATSEITPSPVVSEAGKSTEVSTSGSEEADASNLETEEPQVEDMQEPTPAPDETADAVVEELALPTTQDPLPRGAANEFATDFSIHSVPYSEILSGGPPKDGIPPIDNPTSVSVSEADEWLEDVEPVIFIQVGDDARAYPIQILMWHEITNDVIGGEPITVTFCPLCNTGIAFVRTVDGQVLDFGTSGRLRFSNLIMYDRQTETWWQQASGEAIAGEMTGTQLDFYPAAMISWQDFKTNHPDGQVLSRETGFNRDYGRNPYTGYDNINSSPFLFMGPSTPGTLPAMARVLTVETEEESVAYPYSVLQEAGVINDTVAGQDIVVFWEAGTASALDAGTISSGDDVGTANAFFREVEGQTLTFSLDGGVIVDDQTGSQWNVLGVAVSGDLQGTQLSPVVAINHFWFSWAAFKPDTRVYSAE
jgi:hypothetical protein